MNASDIIRLLNSNHYPPADLTAVEKLCRDYPEFSAAHLLKVRILEAQGQDKQKELKLAAVYAMNRMKLLQLVQEVEKGPEPEPEPESGEEDTGIIQFSEESSEDADVIIAQHAPYAGAEPETDLLELDEQPEEQLLEITEELREESTWEAEEEEAADELLSPVEKGEWEMEEPEAMDVDTPAIDQVDELDEEDLEDKVDEEEQEDREKPVDELAEEDIEDKVDEEEQEELVEQDTNKQLISRFIKEDPGPIRADQQGRLKGDVSLASIREHDGFITDTLAQIYVKQGLFAKAIYAYEKLSLKYPEKSAYFAAQIEKIRNINHS